MPSRIDGKSSQSFSVGTTKDPHPYALSLPDFTSTPATSTAPTGIVVHDFYRDTIFWEADQADSGPQSELQNETTEVINSLEGMVINSTREMSKPFNIEWISTKRIPFYITNSLRNPWNANRKVKWARDGTEVETSVGIQLLRLFH